MPTERKLTDADIAILREVAAGNVYRSESIGTLYDSFCRSLRHRKVNRHVDKLAQRDTPLIRIGDQDRDRFARPWLITDAGLDYLDNLDGRG